MICACRTAALRLFVRSIAQLHVAEGSTTAVPWRAHTRRLVSSAAAHHGASRAWPAGASAWPRSLHSAAARESGAEAAAAGGGGGGGGGGPNSSPATTQDTVSLQDTAEDEGSIPLATKAVNESLTPERKGGRKWKNTRQKADEGNTARAKDAKKKRAKPRQRGEMDEDDGDDDGARPPRKEHWQTQKAALKEKFPEGWRPRKRLSPDALAGIRALNAQFPDEYTTEVLAEKFEVSAEAIRRILKSRWEPSAEEDEARQERWFNRGKQVWSRWAALGKKPPRRWRQEGISRRPRGADAAGRRGTLDGAEEEAGAPGRQQPRQTARVGRAAGRAPRMSVQRKISQNLV